MTLGSTTLDIPALEVVGNARDLRRDLHLFAGYVRGRTVKRSHRGNELSLADRQRLARLLGLDPPARVIDDEEGITSSWINQLDGLALRLGVVRYDTKGVYAGQSSAEPSYPDNYVRFQEASWTAFAQRSPADQESEILRLVGEAEPNEFFHPGVLARLDRFDAWGSATGVVPLIKFAQVRSFLLGLLARVTSGTWIATSAFVAHVKKYHPNFLIPKETRGEAPPRRREPWRSQTKGRHVSEPVDLQLGPLLPRYGNFRECDSARSAWEGTVIPDDAPNGFERVEGRYIERFLEGLPLMLGYVDVAYGPSSDAPPVKPARGTLRAFRVHDRLRRLFEGAVPAPTVTVQPDFQVMVESSFYPLHVMHQLEPMCETLSVGPVSTLRLLRERVTAARAADPGLDCPALLQSLASRPVPQNVAAELAEWTGRGDAFTIYDGFGLLECDEDVPSAAAFRVETVAPGIHIVRDPRGVFTAIEKAERNPLRVAHADGALSLLPGHARTVFPKQAVPAGAGGKAKGPKGPAKADRPPAPVTLERRSHISLRFPEPALLELVCRTLLDARCPVTMDKKSLQLRYSGQHEAQVQAVLDGLAKTHPTRVVEGTD